MKKLLVGLTFSFSLLALSFSANAQYSVLYTFNSTNGGEPTGDVSLWNGLLYGTTHSGGTKGGGSVFQADTNGSNLADIYNFMGNYAAYGSDPYGNLTRAGNKFYGVTYSGGANGDGVVFSIDTNGSGYKDLWDFNESGTSNGTNPRGSLVLLGAKLYGMTSRGGIYYAGNIFSIDTDGSNYTDVFNFNYNDGYSPFGSLNLYGDKFYGMTNNGGYGGAGVIFFMDTNGSNYTVISNFNYSPNNNGVGPDGSLIASDGVLYGMTDGGGANGGGSIFSIDTNGVTYTDLWDFGGGGTNGVTPQGSLLMSGNKFYGLASNGGANGNGTLFSIDTNGAAYTDVYDFSSGSNGEYPNGDVIISGNKLYGMTQDGAPNGGGAIFSIDTTTGSAGSFNQMYNFGSTTTDGTHPQAAFILSNGILYGMTQQGGTFSNSGTIMSIDTNGSNYTQLYSFGKGDSNGSQPYADLTRSGNKIYGTTEFGGVNRVGSIFSMDTNGNNYKDLWDFNDTGYYAGNSNGEYPTCTLVLSGGKLYGMTRNGGADGDGLIFSIDTDGSNYKDLQDFNYSNGGSPEGSLTLLGANLYGMTNQGGANYEGAIFSIDTNGSNYADLFSFNYSDGGYPEYGTLSYSAGKFYGMTYQGGANYDGVVFCIDSSGANYKDLWNFQYNAGTNGGYPDGSVTVSGGVLFGMTQDGGLNNNGNIFSIDTNGSNYTDLYDFDYNPNGAYPYGSLTLSKNTVYGMTSTGDYAYGVIFKDVLISDSTTDTNVICGANSGHATVYVVGGTSPFTYLWSNGGTTDTIGNLSAGTYSVSVIDYAKLRVTASITITQPSQLGNVIASVTSNVTCIGTSSGSAMVSSPSGGSTPYTYMWSDASSQNTATATGLSAGTYNVSVKDNCGADSISATITITQPSQLGNVIASVTSNVTCNGTNSGSAMVSSPSGGNTPYTYMWSNGESTANATGLVAGTYSVSVKDACGADSLSKTITITQPNQLGNVIASVTSNITCNGTSSGSAMVSSPSGGNTPYTYLWSDASSQNTATATGLSAGTYNVSVMDACGADSLSKTITITQPNQLGNVIASVTSNVTCIGTSSGSAMVSSPSGGTTPYTYLWSDASSQNTATATGLSAGTYNVSVKDNCGADSISATITITQPNQLGNVIASVTSNVTCNGTNSGSAMVSSPSGGTTPYTYLWSDASSQNTAIATGLSAGTYNVSVMDACGADSVSSTITITQPSQLGNVIASVTSNVTCNGTSSGSAMVSSPSGGNTPYTYLWSDASSQNTASATGLSAGTYNVSVKDNCGADSVSMTITITQPSQLGNVIASVTSNITCNGTSSGSAMVSSPSGGNTPYTYLWSDASSQNTATATGLSAGTYNVSVMDACGADSVSSTIAITQPASLGNVIASVTGNVTCNGTNSGSAMVNSPSGGTTPYTYMWSNGESTASATGLSAGTYNVSVKDNCGADSISATITITQPSQLGNVIASVISNVSCNGTNSGSAMVSSPSGGTTPYTYLWSDASSQNTATATGLSAGTYNVSVMDACGADSISATITITQPNQLGNVIASVTGNVTCNGTNSGSAMVSSPSGGSTPYTYMWSDASSQNTATATGLSAGTYNVSVMDNCGADSISATITITQPAMLSNTAVTVISNVTCAGSTNGSASVSPSGGSTPYTYLWSDGNSQSTATATGLSAGSYTVNISDACGADSVATVTISSPTALTVTIFSGNIKCYGDDDGFAHAHAHNGSFPYTYSWSNSETTNDISGLSAGTYSVAVTDACGSLVTETVTLTQPTAVVVTSDSTADNGSGTGTASVTASGGIAPYTYDWAPGGATTNSISGLSAGSYCCTVSDRNGCGQTVCVTVKSTLGIDNITNASTINIYPNPTIGSFTISGVTQGQVIELYDYIGQRISSTVVSNNTTMHFDISNKANGVYLVRILNTDGTLATEKKMIKTQ